MKKTLITLLLLSLTFSLTAQSDDDLFGSDDDFFGDDTISEVSDVSAKSDLSKGVIFDTGSIKIGGNLKAQLSTNTILYSPEEDDLGENIYRTKLLPDLSAMLSVDARPTQTLRLYTKFGFAYPFEDKINSYSFTTVDSMLVPPASFKFSKPDDFALYFNKFNIYSKAKTETYSSITNWFRLKELFTDFSVNDTAFFRFGIHTVTWGAGYFFSPVSDLINASSIDPEHPEEQVDGSLNLRTQIIIPNSQNCLWFYVIPSTNFTNQTAESYARETAFAGKADILLGNWELGVGGLFKYQNAPKATLTATGSLKKISFFGEFVYSYGAASEWLKNTDWDDKTSIFQATAGFSYYWKEPKLNIAAQYYWESNDVDIMKKVSQYGHNVALSVTKGELFKNQDLSVSLFAIGNFGHKDITSDDILSLNPMAAMQFESPADIDAAVKNAKDSQVTFMTNLMLNYSPVKDIRFGAGPVLTFKDFETNPTLSFKITAALGGGNF